MSGKYKVKLHHGARTFSAWSSHRQELLGTGSYDRVIFFIHGFPDNNDSYHSVVPLVTEHYKNEKVLTLCPLLRGYERSSQGKDNEYCVFEMAEDVQAWILEVNPDKKVPVHLVGHDWGAIIAFKAASKYPDLITSVVTLAIPYLTNLHLWHLLWYAPSQVYCLSYMLTMQLLLLYKNKFGDVTKPGYLDSLWDYWSPGWDFSKEIESVRTTLSDPAVLEAATAYYRNLVPWKNLKETRWNVQFDKVPTLILGGEKDGCMVSAVYELESRILGPTPKVKVQLLSGVGHFMHREDPVKVSELICGWFDKYP